MKKCNGCKAVWVDVHERLPKIGDKVIAYSVEDGINYDVYFDISDEDDDLWRRSGRCNMENVTHWQPSLVPPSSPIEIRYREYDVHFNLHGYFWKIKAQTLEKAKETADKWLTDSLTGLKREARTGLGGLFWVLKLGMQ